MDTGKAILRREERYILGLRRLYENFGYKNFKMSKFEKYDLYHENKSFLRNANIITVSDPAGRLLALKPDITLSIVKNVRSDTLPEKLYYNENIYFADSEDREIKETTQVGLEYIGELDIRSLGEILLLAAKSLEATGCNYRVAISHMGFVSGVIEAAGLGQKDKDAASEFIKDKNLHGLKQICERNNLSEEASSRLCGLISVCGKLDETALKSEALVVDSVKDSYEEILEISNIISSFGLSDKFILDFSVMNDFSYYNGLVFQGFVDGVPKTVLSGGRYDNLVKRFGCDTSAAGFAVYTDLLSRYFYGADDFDGDVLLVYANDCNPCDVLKAQEEITNGGESCVAVTIEPLNKKYKRKLTMLSDGSLKNE